MTQPFPLEHQRHKRNGNKRGRLDILASMLRLIAERQNIKKTHIMYGANLSFEQLQQYLCELGKVGLIKFDAPAFAKIEITERGRNYLKHYTSLEGLLDGEAEKADATVNRYVGKGERAG